MSVYLDANIIVATFIQDSLTPKASAIVTKIADALIVSDLAALEFASTVARKVREGTVSAMEVRIVLANFDNWIAAMERVQTESTDVAVADSIVRRFDINLHGTDAIHVALATRLGASMLTLDAKMKANAKKLGLAVI